MEYCQPHYLCLLMLMEIIQGNRLARPTTLPPGQLSWQLAAWWVDCQSFQDIWFPSCSPGELLASQALQLAPPQALQLGWGLPGVRNQALLLESAMAGVCKRIYFGNSEMFPVFHQPGQYQYFTTLKTKSVKICSATMTTLDLLLPPCWFPFTKLLFFVPFRDEGKIKTVWISCQIVIPFLYHVSGRKISWFQRMEKIRSILRIASLRDRLFNFCLEWLWGFVVLK